MQDPKSLRKERQNLKRALADTEAEEAAGQIEGDREKIKELLILRIAQIDRLIGDRAD
jgi:ribosomal protein L29